ncbi:MAG: hypothetical protein A3D65_00755 [Candidatus Lloydbacteria bacterium RIFCSPHIGHO2_02_FULL_50_13]|uniref:Transcriptional regulator n=1 Tax=Candidatus Lloydbacteria bacterium RIFCSPHIGHO2_02_FULL_50_13 TaxID=1798661 RepID=A0A1G2D0P4_9BACT|nr:MAG: hypothetical protein A3D65_00755 [Candidatus Lloydbacteria bacterium RIFCSPHIGHO2_02_FULL_50_13]
MPWFERSISELEKFAVKRAVARVIDAETFYPQSGYPAVRAFEHALSMRLGDFPVVGLNSGTDALVSALRLVGVQDGDEVIVPAFSYISTASSVLLAGGTPVFVDVSEDDYAVDPTKVEAKVTKRTKAIIVAHLFGQPALGMNDILLFAKKHKLFVVEDAAQSFGATMTMNGKERSVGTMGDFGCLSFSSTKILAAPGNGGALVIKDSAFLEDARRMRFYGAKRPYFDYPLLGGNTGLHEVQAAALFAKLDFFDHWLFHRKTNADVCQNCLAQVEELMLPRARLESARTWYRYVIRSKERDTLFERLARRARQNWHLMPGINYPVPLPYFKVFERLGYAQGDFPIAEKLSSEVLSLPITNDVSRDDVMGIVREIEKFFGDLDAGTPPGP